MKSNENTKLFIKRGLAFLIDIILVSFIASAVLMCLPENKEMKKLEDRLISLTEQYDNKEITDKQYTKEFSNIQYDMTKSQVDLQVVTIVVTLIYFVAFPLIVEGKTLGKKVMKIKLIPYNDRKLNLFNLVIRTIFVANIISMVGTLACVTFMSKSSYLSFEPVLNAISAVIVLGCGLLALGRQDSRGLHDILGGTRVIFDNVEFNEELGQEELGKKIDEVKNTLKEAREGFEEDKEEIIAQSKDLERTIKEVKKLKAEGKISEAKVTEKKKTTKKAAKTTKKVTKKTTSKPRIVAKENK